MKKTSDVWSEYLGIKILDPDGWDRENFQYSFYEEYITEDEFKERADMSTTQYYPHSPKEYADADNEIVGDGTSGNPVFKFKLPDKYVLDIDKVKTLEDVIAILDGVELCVYGDNLDEKTKAITDKYFKKGE